jgi:adenine-specific DNA-methyltransferase
MADETKPRAEAVTVSSASPLGERLEGLKQLVPEAFVEGKVDFDQLRAALGDAVNDQPERYSFTWAGKRDAMRILQMPTRATLIPAPEESVNGDTTKNLFIEGDNLEVLKLLLKPYYGRIKMIYIDPPYNTGNDFIYPDNYADPLDTYLRLTGQKDAAGNLLTSNPETSGRYHSAWLSMMYPRLFLARQLLSEDGVIFVSIDDHEVHNLRLLMNEAFGEDNFLCSLIWKRRQNVDSRSQTGVSVDHEYLIAYSCDKDRSRLRGQEKDLTKYSNPDNDPRGPWSSDNLVGLATKQQRPNLHYALVNPATGIAYPCAEAGWRYSRSTMARLIEEGRIIWPPTPSGRPRLKRYLHELADEFTGLSSVLATAYSTDGTTELKQLFGGKDVLDFPKPVDYIKLLVQQGTDAGGDAAVLDFFAGSCTTAQAVLQLNRQDGGQRRFIMVQLPEPTPEGSPARRSGFRTIADIGKERIRRVIARMQAERAGQLDLRDRATPEDLGFKVFKLAPSNFRAWFGVAKPDGQDYARQMELFADALIEGWTPERVIAEVALKEAGFGLNYRTEPVSAVKEQKVYRVADGDSEQHFYICLDERVRLEALRPLALQREDLLVCRARALDDEAAANLALQCRLRTI